MRSERQTEETAKKKKNRLLKAVLILIPLLIALIAVSILNMYKAAEKSLSLSFTEEDITLEFGKEYPAMDFVADSEGDVLPAEEFLDTGSTGENSMVYTVRKPLLGGILAPSRKYTLKYSVEDTVPPVMLWSGDGAVVKKGSKFYINDVVGFGDNADPEPKITYEGSPDTDTEGRYPLHVVVTDASGNKTSWNLTIEVKENLPSYMDNSERTKFSDFVKTYKGDGRTFGIDVSDWQDDIDFEAVKKAGCDFVMIRVGWSKEGEVSDDKRFDQNIERARAAGLKVGLYLYSYDSTEENARKSAKYIVDKLDGSSLDLPVAFDWEDFGQFQTYRMSFYTLNRMYDAFADELSKGGYDCMLYGSKLRLENAWDKTDERPVWLAHYTDETDYEGPYRIWQQSCTGRINGIGGDVDMDIMYED